MAFYVEDRIVSVFENGILKIASVGDCGLRVIRKGANSYFLLCDFKVQFHLMSLLPIWVQVR